MSDLSHDDLAHNLAQHLQNDGRMVWENIPAGMAGEVRPDVYTIEKSFANPNPMTYEVKVSLSDFRSDVTAAKWKSYLRFSYGVVFAVPKGLITKNELPIGCGLITYNGEGLWHTVKKPTLHPCNLDGNVLLKLLIGGAERMTSPKTPQIREACQWKQMEALRKKFGKNIGEKISLVDKYPAMKKELKTLKKELGELLGVDTDRWCFERDAKHQIEKIKIMADETERKAAIAKQLETLKETLGIHVDKIIREYST